MKTIWQFVALSLALLFFEANWVVTAAVWIAVVLTVISGVDYLRKNAKHLSMN